MSTPNWLKGTFPEWLVVALIGIIAWFLIQYIEEQKLFRREANARLTLIERQLAVLEVQLRLRP
jgi:hypothetical protein